MTYEKLARYPEAIVEEIQRAIREAWLDGSMSTGDEYLWALYPRFEDGVKVLGVITRTESCALTPAMVKALGIVEIAGEPFVLRIPDTLDCTRLEHEPMPLIEILKTAGPLDEPVEDSRKLLMASDVSPCIYVSCQQYPTPTGWPR